MPVMNKSNIYRDLRKSPSFEALKSSWKGAITMYEEIKVAFVSSDKPILIPAWTLLVEECTVRPASGKLFNGTKW